MCSVCAAQFSRYKCPKCAIAYCSLACYRQHGETCTESFYAEQAQAELKSDVAPHESRLEMLKTLQRLEETNDSDSGDDDDDDGDDDNAAAMPPHDAERLARLLEATTIDESSLTNEERAEFRRLLADGSLGAQLQAAPVWWRAAEAALASMELVGTKEGGASWRYASDEAAAAAASAGAPPPSTALPALRTLTCRPPPATLLHNALELLCAYCYVVRLFCAAEGDDPAAQKRRTT